jgi:hypothetical protein
LSERYFEGDWNNDYFEGRIKRAPPYQLATTRIYKLFSATLKKED